MTGRLAVIGLLAAALTAGAVLWHRQVFVEYSRFEGSWNGFGTVLKLAGSGNGIPLSGIEGIQGPSSPLKFRACFRTDPASVPKPAGATSYRNPTPLTVPDWFDCFDAAELGADLEAGRAQAFLVQAEIADGIDLVAAFYPDGRGFAWRQVNIK